MYEVIDGQQRTISAAQYVSGDYSLDGRYFHNLQDNEQMRWRKVTSTRPSRSVNMPNTGSPVMGTSRALG